MNRHFAIVPLLLAIAVPAHPAVGVRILLGLTDTESTKWDGEATARAARIREIAEIVAATFPGCNLVFSASSADNRSYRVSFDKIRKHLPVFKCAWDAKRGAVQLYELFKRIDMTPEVFQFRTLTRLKQLEYLIKTQQIDDHFFWKK